MSAEKLPRRVRADVLMCDASLADSRAKAQALILAGEVFADGKRVDKPGMTLPANAKLEVVLRRRFVSRGGEKLEGALHAFRAELPSVKGFFAVDIGASTGGFTDCLLQRGAARVVAVDVGHGQLDARLASDPRVEVRDRTNARDLAPSHFQAPIDLVTVDASFIGLDKLLPAIANILPDNRWLIALVKPQFEAGIEAVRAGRGVIRDAAERQSAIDTAKAAMTVRGFSLVAEADSVLPGPKGNLERFVLAQRVGPGP